jgi:GcrA cell cycle regulator
MPKGKIIDWNAEKIAELRGYAEGGLTAKQSGERMAISDTAAQSAASKFGIKFNGKILATWPDHVVEEMKRLAAEGESARQIAIVLKISRGAVCGKMKRLGLTLRGVGRPPPRAGAVVVRQMRRKPPPRPVTPPELLLCEPVSLVDLAREHCRFPVIGEGADTLFCGAPADDGASYCPAHRWRCMTPPIRAVKPPREFRARSAA